MSTEYYEKNKVKLQNEASEMYQNSSEEKKKKKSSNIILNAIKIFLQVESKDYRRNYYVTHKI